MRVHGRDSSHDVIPQKAMVLLSVVFNPCSGQGTEVYAYTDMPTHLHKPKHLALMCGKRT